MRCTAEADGSLESRKGSTRLGDFCQNPVLHPRGSAVGCIRARDNQQLDEAGLGLDVFGMATNKGLEDVEAMTANGCVYPGEELSCEDRVWRAIEATLGQGCPEQTQSKAGEFSRQSRSPFKPNSRCQDCPEMFEPKQREAADYKACAVSTPTLSSHPTCMR